LGEGAHSFSVRATDLSGTREPNPPVFSWRVDTLAPETGLLATPPAVTADVNGSFSFSGSEAGGSFACSLDSAPWSACGSPFSIQGVAEGFHDFAVRAIDAAGNIDPSPAVCSWNVARNVLLSRSGLPESYHVSLGAALAGVAPGSSVQLRVRNRELSGDLVVDGCASVALQGGLAADFSSGDGVTAIAGSVYVRCGTLMVKELTIRRNNLLLNSR
jgi:hypothetical protein